MGINHRRHCVGGIVKAIDEFEAQGEGQGQKKEEGCRKGDCFPEKFHNTFSSKVELDAPLLAGEFRKA
jgi:hypothetical protein